ASRSDRRAIAEDVTRVSRKLHLRRGRLTIKAQTGAMIELGAVAFGDFLLALGVHASSNVAAIAGMAVWVVALQPLVKVATGAALGVRYDYAYLAHGEPRFKMEYGSYLAQPRWARIVLHMSGAVGSPLGAYLAARLVRGALPMTYRIAIVVFWMTNALNLVLFVAGLFGIKRIGVSRAVDTSCGAAGAEIREAVGW
ncbi:MAG TPA: hypothetical protein VGR40_08945, partial [Candidatus Binatus sp.]|nr:hypothetical protein [Candidatus Binatus sp.]